MEREEGKGGSRPQTLDARPGLHLRFMHSAEMSVLLQTGCNADSAGCTHRGPVCPVRLMQRGPSHVQRGGVPGLHLLMYDRKMLFFMVLSFCALLVKPVNTEDI